MSHDIRPRLTSMTICDLCDQEITQDDQDGGYNHGSLMHAQGGRDVSAQTKRVRLWWSPRTWPGFGNRAKAIGIPESLKDERRWDFHGRCIVLLVEENLNCYANGVAK